MGAALFLAGRGEAQPPAPAAFCDVYPDVPACSSGEAACTTCHDAPPALNVYGASVSSALLNPIITDTPVTLAMLTASEMPARYVWPKRPTNDTPNNVTPAKFPSRGGRGEEESVSTPGHVS